jgi:hypothetical protein
MFGTTETFHLVMAGVRRYIFTIAIQISLLSLVGLYVAFKMRME